MIEDAAEKKTKIQPSCPTERVEKHASTMYFNALLLVTLYDARVRVFVEYELHDASSAPIKPRDSRGVQYFTVLTVRKLARHALYFALTPYSIVGPISQIENVAGSPATSSLK